MILKYLAKILIKILSKESRSDVSGSTFSYELLQKSIQPGDVLLVEGGQLFSTAIKYLTQSNWSHSAIYIGSEELIEADIKKGVRKIPLREYEKHHTRICRPVGLDEKDLQHIFSFLEKRVGHQYDLKNVFDLARYLIPLPPIPGRWKRDVLEFGSGDPTKVICSSLISEAFQVIKYPILPQVTYLNSKTKQEAKFVKRHHTLFAPADFDRSPYFKIIKPTVEFNFNFKELKWSYEGL
jgi:hypothetical protein